MGDEDDGGDEGGLEEEEQSAGSKEKSSTSSPLSSCSIWSAVWNWVVFENDVISGGNRCDKSRR